MDEFILLGIGLSIHSPPPGLAAGLTRIGDPRHDGDATNASKHPMTRQTNYLYSRIELAPTPASPLTQFRDDVTSTGRLFRNEIYG